jgi:hypothetical protein
MDPTYVPEAETQSPARDLLASWLPNAEYVRVSVTDDIRFIDQGSNFEAIFCPKCGAELDKQWWQKVMISASSTVFTNLIVITPCCGSTLSLNELRYVWPAGFARFVLEARNPNGDISEAALNSLSSLLKAEMKKIWAHY